MNLLIVDDEPNIRKTTSLALKTMGHRPFAAADSRQAEDVIEKEKIDAMFLDLMLGQEHGLDYLQRLRAERPGLPVIVFTAFSSLESAVESMRQGAYDYVQKPFVPEEIRQMLIKLEKSRQLRRDVDELAEQVAEQQSEEVKESADPQMKDVYRIAFRAAEADANLLLLGPSGTGKSVLARQVHDRSNRRNHPFLTVNCPSLSGELLESELFGHTKGAFTGAVRDTWGKVAAAEGGTLFLDEIGELPLPIQPKLLRLLQDREYERVGENRTRRANVRVIAATNRNLRAEVDAGHFRGDLFYRLNVITVELPSLASRPADILPLADAYLRQFAERDRRPGATFTPAAREALQAHPWPGNLRELRNVVERAVILSPTEAIEIEKLDAGDGKATGAHTGQFVTLAQLEEEHLRRVVDSAPSLEEAAQILGIDSATLYRKRKKLGLTK